MTGLDEARVYRTGGDAEEHRGEELEQDPPEVFLAEEELHPSLDEIFRQIDASHKRAEEWRSLRPAHARHGSR